MRFYPKTILVSTILSFTSLLSTVSFGDIATEATTPEASNLVQVLPAKGFCSQIESVLSSQFKFKSKFAMERSASELVDMLRTNRASDYIPAKILTEAKVDTDAWGRGQFFPLTDILASVLGSKGNVIISFDTADLKHLPFVQQDTHIVLVTKNVSPLNTARAKAVAFSAKRLQIKVSVLWIGDKAGDEAGVRDGAELAYVAGLTGGLFVNLGGPANPCMMTSH